MRRFFDLDDAARERPADSERVATVGFFDGIHLGHQRVLDELKGWAASVSAEPVVVTFDRHPQAVLDGHPPVPVISLEHRLLLLEREGIAATLVLHFDRELASWPPERFVADVLQGALGARRLLLGFDSAFGRGRRGTYEYLHERSAELELEVRRSDAVWLGNDRVSSTLVREALLGGDLDRARELLGRRFSVLGRVVHGDHRGASIGFPTANLDIGEAALLPRGVYFARAVRLGASPEHAAAAGTSFEEMPAVMNVGRCPTFSGEESERGAAFDPARDRVEVHILDFRGELYGEWLEVHIERKHRDERRFPSVEALVEQIRADVEARRAAAGPSG